MLFKLSNLNSNLALTLGYLNPALNNSAQAYTYRANPSHTIFLTLRLSKPPMLWVYSLFLASLAFFAWIEQLFWFSQRPSRWLCWRNSPFPSNVVRSWPLNFEDREVASYSLSSLVRMEMINSLMCSFSSATGIQWNPALWTPA